MIRIVVAEDFHLVREGICKILEESKDFEIAGQAENGIETLSLVKELNPDVLVLDISMPQMDGIEVLKQLQKMESCPKVVVLSIYADTALVRQALEIGALGYVLKQSISEELMDAIQAANRGSSYLSSGVSHILTIHAVNRQPQNPLNRLSPREREVVKKTVAGLSTKEIAAIFQISIKTVEKQRRDAMRKLEVDNIASLVRMSLELGLVTDSSDEQAADYKVS